jgi:hypothetical protein
MIGGSAEETLVAGAGDDETEVRGHRDGDIIKF